MTQNFKHFSQGSNISDRKGVNYTKGALSTCSFSETKILETEPL